jgi:hypothetical protein
MSFQIPGAAELTKLRSEVDGVIESVTKVLDFVEKYGHYIPGLSGAVSGVQGIDDALQGAKAMIDHI